MTWTYSGDPSISDKDGVRFEIGDTIENDPQFSDEEIQHVLDVNVSVLRAAAHCCEILSRKYARQADIQLGPQRVYASQRSQAYRALAKELGARIAGSYAPSADIKEGKGAFRRNLMTGGPCCG